MTFLKYPQSDPLPSVDGFPLFLRLRWLAAAAQLLLGTYCILKLRLSLPWSVLGVVTAYLGLTNALLWVWRERFRVMTSTLVPSLLFLDTLMLTLMLYVSGGLQNPFLVVYVLHVVIGSLLLPPGITFMLLLFTGIAMGVLSHSPYPLYSVETLRNSPDSTLHIRGVLVAQLGTAAGIGWFVYRLRRELERSRERVSRQEAQLKRARQFEALATFASGMAHELATPLGTIAVVSAELDRKSCTLCHKTECTEDARLIRGEVERCKDILQRLRLTDAMDKRLAAVPVDLSRLPVELPAHLSAEHAARVHWEIPDNLPVPTLPKLGLLQALSILIKNACEADPEGGKVQVRLREEAGGLRCAVRDQGGGMDADTLQKVGEPFFTTKQPGFGTGLGLFLVRTFLDQVNGELVVESTPGEGSCFEMRIPLT